MSNPINYRSLFDFDGLDEALKSLEQSEKQFATAVSGDLKKIAKDADALKRSLLNIKDGLNALDISKDSGKSRLNDLTNETEKVTKAYRAQNEAVSAGKKLIQDNKEEVAKLRTEQAKLRAELEKGKVTQQQYRTEASKIALEMKQLDLANRQARSSIKAASGSYYEAQKRLSELGKQIKSAEGGFKSSNPVIKAQIKEYRNLSDELKKFDAQLGHHYRNVGNYRSAVGGMATSLLGWAAAYVSVSEGISFVFNKSLEFDAIRSSLAVSFNSMDAAEQKMDQLQTTAEMLGIEYITLAKSYKQFIGAAIASEFPLEQAEKIFQSVANASAKMKLSSEQTEGALRALEQMISKGNVQAEELRGQLGERLPGAFAIAARAMGVSTSELNKMLKDGEVLASDLLPKLANELDKTFGNDQTEKVKGLGAAWNRLKNVFSTGVDENNRISKFFETAINGATNFFDIIVKTVNSSSWQEFFARVTGSTAEGDLIKNINKSFDDGSNVLNNPANFNISSSSPERIKIQYETVSTAYKNAKKAYQDYSKAVEDGTLKDGGKRSLEQYSKLVDVLGSKMFQLARFLPEATKKGTKEIETTTKTTVEGTKKAKQGFAELQDQLTKLKLQLEIGLLDGTIDKTDNVLAQNIIARTRQLEKLKQLYEQVLQPKVSPLSKFQGSPDENIQVGELNKERTLKEIDEVYNEISLQNINFSQFSAKLLEDYQAGTLSKIEYDTKLFDVESFHKQQGFILEKQVLEKRLQTTKKYSREYYSILEQLADLEVKLQESKNEQYLKGEELRRKAIKETLDIFRQSSDFVSQIFGSEMGNLFSTVLDDLDTLLNKSEEKTLEFADKVNLISSTLIAASQAYTASVIQSSEVRIQQLEKEKQHELEGAGNNDAAKRKIEAEYNKKISAERKKQAIAQKQAAIFNIGIATAQGVVSALASLPPNVPLSIAIGAIGLAQLAVVASKPIPGFWKGTKNSPEGIAEIAERGPEIVESPSGKKEIVEKRQFKYLEKGSKVYTADETKHILSIASGHDARQLYESNGTFLNNANATIQKSINNQHSSEYPIDYDKMTSSFSKSVKSIPVNEHHYNERGYEVYRRNANTRIKDLNRRNSRSGNG